MFKQGSSGGPLIARLSSTDQKDDSKDAVVIGVLSRTYDWLQLSMFNIIDETRAMFIKTVTKAESYEEIQSRMEIYEKVITTQYATLGFQINQDEPNYNEIFCYSNGEWDPNLAGGLGAFKSSIVRLKPPLQNKKNHKSCIRQLYTMSK